MGFTDKLKTTIDEMASAASDKIDNAGISVKISDKKNEIEKIEREIGGLIYKSYAEGKASISDEVNALCDKIKGLMEEIEELEKQKKNSSKSESQDPEEKKE